MTVQRCISGGDASLSLDQGAAISIGTGASMEVGGMVVRGGQAFDANKPPQVQGGRDGVITWVSFHFETNDESVFPFLETSLNGVREFVGALSSI